jgi:DNA repair protein RadC
LTDKRSEKPHYLGHRQRLRDRFLAGGAGALHDYEMLELLLYQARPRGDMKPLAKTLLRRFGGFAGVVAASPRELAEVENVGEASIVALKTVQAAALLMARQELIDRPVIGSWQKLLDYCHAAMAHEKVEQFRLLFLDGRNALIADELQQRGTINHTPVYPRGVIAGARARRRRDHHAAQPSVGRPGAVAGRHCHDPRGGGGGRQTGHRPARPRHHRPQGPCQPAQPRAAVRPAGSERPAPG